MYKYIILDYNIFFCFCHLLVEVEANFVSTTDSTGNLYDTKFFGTISTYPDIFLLAQNR